MLSFTQAAIDEIAVQISKRGIEGTKLRLGVRSGGCSGFSYVIEFHDGDPNKQDNAYSLTATDGTNVTVVVDKKSERILENTTLDWEDRLMRRGFVFNNLDAKSTCGCGASFSAHV